MSVVRAKYRKFCSVLVAAWVLAASAICGAGEEASVSGVRELQRANESLQRGELQAAHRDLRRVLMDAWSRDDLLLGGQASYSLGAYYASIDEPQEADRWLIDSHHALRMADASTVDVALLRARLAADLGQFELAERLLRQSCFGRSPCDPSVADTNECFEQACREGCLECLPCIGKCIRQKRVDQECEASVEVKRILTTAHIRLAAGDIAGAATRSRAAGALLPDVCDAGLWADHFDVAGRIALSRHQWSMAACRFDQELRYLKIAQQYLAVPDVLKRAALAHQNSGNWPAAADRWNRLARVMVARGCYTDAWKWTTDAAEFARESSSDALMIRISLTAEAIRDAVTPDGSAEPNGCIGAMIEDRRPSATYDLIEPSRRWRVETVSGEWTDPSREPTSPTASAANEASQTLAEMLHGAEL